MREAIEEENAAGRADGCWRIVLYLAQSTTRSAPVTPHRAAEGPPRSLENSVPEIAVRFQEQGVGGVELRAEAEVRRLN